MGKGLWRCETAVERDLPYGGIGRLQQGSGHFQPLPHENLPKGRAADREGALKLADAGSRVGGKVWHKGGVVRQP